MPTAPWAVQMVLVAGHFARSRTPSNPFLTYGPTFSIMLKQLLAHVDSTAPCPLVNPIVVLQLQVGAKRCDSAMAFNLYIPVDNKALDPPFSYSQGTGHLNTCSKSNTTRAKRKYCACLLPVPNQISGEKVHSHAQTRARGESKGREIKSGGISRVVIPRLSPEKRNDSNGQNT